MKFFLVLSAALLLVPAANSQYDRLLQGVAYFKQHHYKSALREFQNAHLVRPGDPIIDNLIGVTETKLGCLHDANSFYKLAIATDPTAINPYKNLGVNYLTEKQYSLAEKDLLKASELAPQDPFVHYYLAALYLDTAHYADAVKQWKPAKSLIENDPQMLLQIASACVRLNRKDESAAAISELEARNMLGVSQEYSLGVLLTEHHMYSQALERFERIVRMERPSFADKFNLAVALINADELQQAIKVLQPLTKDHPDDPQPFSLLGSLYEATGSDSKALSAYAAAVRLDPSSADRYLAYTRLLMELDRYGEAAKVLNQGMKKTPEPYALNLRLGAVEMAQGQLSQARLSFRRAILENPVIPLGYYGLAESYIRQGRDMAASVVLSSALRKLPPSSNLEYLYGLTLLHMSKTREAVTAFEKSVALNPRAEASHYELGTLYSRAGNFQQARAEFEQTLKIAPNSIRSLYQLSRIYQRLGDSDKAKEIALQIHQLLQRRSEVELQIQKARFLGTKTRMRLRTNVVVRRSGEFNRYPP